MLYLRRPAHTHSRTDLIHWPSIFLKHPSWVDAYKDIPNTPTSCHYAWNYCHADKECLTVTLTSPTCPSSPFCHYLRMWVLPYKDYLRSSVWLNMWWKLRFPSDTRLQIAVKNTLSGFYELVVLFFGPCNVSPFYFKGGFHTQLVEFPRPMEIGFLFLPVLVVSAENHRPSIS